jgi:hypothetical protein
MIMLIVDLTLSRRSGTGYLPLLTGEGAGVLRLETLFPSPLRRGVRSTTLPYGSVEPKGRRRVDRLVESEV